MTTLIAVSPHLDDAVFSVGAMLARHAEAGWRVIVATCFTASVPDPVGFALACQLDKGLGPEVDYMALRRAEDATACALLGAEAIHLAFPEAPHRGYGSAAALFAPPHEHDDIADTLAPALDGLLRRHEPARILGPAAIGSHVDHLVVRRVLERLGVGAELWADLPYAARVGAPAPRRAEPVAELLERKTAACAAYVSQLGFQFGGEAGIARAIQIDGAELILAVT